MVKTIILLFLYLGYLYIIYDLIVFVVWKTIKLEIYFIEMCFIEIYLLDDWPKSAYHIISYQTIYSYILDPIELCVCLCVCVDSGTENQSTYEYYSFWRW